VRVWTNGRWHQTLGWEAVEDDVEACGMVGWLGGGQSGVVDGDPHGRRQCR
jgi:hypothetical protein